MTGGPFQGRPVVRVKSDARSLGRTHCCASQHPGVVGQGVCLFHQGSCLECARSIGEQVLKGSGLAAWRRMALAFKPSTEINTTIGSRAPDFRASPYGGRDGDTGGGNAPGEGTSDGLGRTCRMGPPSSAMPQPVIVATTRVMTKS